MGSVEVYPLRFILLTATQRTAEPPFLSPAGNRKPAGHEKDIFYSEVVVMAARLTDRQKKRIIADWIEMQSYNAVAKKHGVTHQTVKRIVDASPDISEKVQQKKEENTAEMLAFMESQKGAMQEAIILHLKALTDPEKISAATLSQIATSFGIIVDKATKNTASSNDSLNKLDGLLKEFRDAIKPEAN